MLRLGALALALRVNGEAAECASVLKAGEFRRGEGESEVIKRCEGESTSTVATTSSTKPPYNLLNDAIYYYNYYYDSHALNLCEGDCDDDGDCAVGLKCGQRSPGEPSPDAHCSLATADAATQQNLSPEFDIGYDFCIP